MRQSLLDAVVTGNVRDLMDDHHTTQVDLAAVLGISQPAVSNKLAGRSRWTLDDLEALADHYGIRSSDLLRMGTKEVKPARETRSRRRPVDRIAS